MAPEAGREVLLDARGIAKTYPRNARGVLRLGQALLGLAPRGAEVLHDVAFELARGEALGIVGRNGSGKSTLLQIACGTLAPSAGSVERRGRVAAMLELGAGFKPEFTGRENATLNAALLGVGSHEIAGRMDAVEAFADIGDYFDRPVAEYSSGMAARLAFAVCANVDADILVVDEVLAVGDAAFQARCRRFIEDFLGRGAVLFVSHDEEMVQSVCNRAIWLERGKVMASGPPETVLRRYRHAMEGAEAATHDGVMQAAAHDSATMPLADDPRRGGNPVTVSPFQAMAPRHGNGRAVIDDVGFVDAQGQRLDVVQGGSEVMLRIGGRALGDLSRPIAGFIFRDRAGQNMFGDNTYLTYRDRPVAMAAGDRFEARLAFRLPFLPDGSYSIAPSLIEGTQRSHSHLVWMEEAIVLSVHDSPVSIGKIGVPMEFRATIRPGR